MDHKVAQKMRLDLDKAHTDIMRVRDLLKELRGVDADRDGVEFLLGAVEVALASVGVARGAAR